MIRKSVNHSRMAMAKLKFGVNNVYYNDGLTDYVIICKHIASVISEFVFNYYNFQYIIQIFGVYICEIISIR